VSAVYVKQQNIISKKSMVLSGQILPSLWILCLVVIFHISQHPPTDNTHRLCASSRNTPPRLTEHKIPLAVFSMASINACERTPPPAFTPRQLVLRMLFTLSNRFLVPAVTP